MLIRLPAIPKKNNERVNTPTEVDKDNSMRINGYKKDPMINIGLLPYRETSQPERGRLTIKPAGKANNTPPRPASLKCNLFFIAGIRLAQVENVRPAIKKNTLAAILYLLNNSDFFPLPLNIFLILKMQK
jgi:hypothetical protein